MEYQVKYESIQIGDFNYRIRSLKDRQQYSDPQGVAARAGISSATWPLFGVIWHSSLVLAEIMHEYKIQGLKILEIGCGLGLASLVAHRRGADVTASDYHPMASLFLTENLSLNNFPPLNFKIADWAKSDHLLGKFDLIIGSDLLYEPDHPGLVSAFIDRNSNKTVKVIIIDPGRRLQGKFNKKMSALGYSYTSENVSKRLTDNSDYKGKILTYSRKSD
ncbi:MAG: class I SAM-dependent methyltransferase [Desulfurivibrionaceae bacterium]